MAGLSLCVGLVAAGLWLVNGDEPYRADVSEKDVATLNGRGLRPGDLRVTASGIEITLLPVAR